VKMPVWLRWKLYGLAVDRLGACPANAHSALIWGSRSVREMAVDRTCRRDCAANGSCWCGKLRRAGDPS
jgi:hypothetical protein